MMMVMRTNQTARKKADLVGPTTFKRLQVCGRRQLKIVCCDNLWGWLMSSSGILHVDDDEGNRPC